MPFMDGAQLLETVKEKYPEVVRMVLSGQANRETVLRSLGPAHQYVSKPCNPGPSNPAWLRPSSCAIS